MNRLGHPWGGALERAIGNVRAFRHRPEAATEEVPACPSRDAPATTLLRGVEGSIPGGAVVAVAGPDAKTSAWRAKPFGDSLHSDSIEITVVQDYQI